jgi:plastocyanin
MNGLANRLLLGSFAIAAPFFISTNAQAQEGRYALQQASSCDNPSVDQPICLTLNQDQTATLGSGLAAKIDNVTFGPSFTNAVGDTVDFSGQHAVAVTVHVTVTNNSGKEQEISRGIALGFSFTMALPGTSIDIDSGGMYNFGDSDGGLTMDGNYLPANPFPSPNPIFPDNPDLFDSTFTLYPGDSTTGNLVFRVPQDKTSGLRLLAPYKGTAGPYVAWTINP